MSGKYALIVANTQYTDPGLSQLTAPGKDAKEFARVLDSREICSFDDVIILYNEEIFKVNETIDYFFSLRKPDDLLLMYFSGHGVRDEYGSLYLAVKNTNRARLRSTAVKSDFIREAMDHSRSKRQILILDCCNSGAFAHGTKAELGGSVGTATAFEGTGFGRIVLTASDSTQFAWEGDQVIGDTENSLFTHYLVKGLEGEADTDGDGSITIDELYDYAYEQIVTRTPKQTPGKWSYKQQGEIFLRKITGAINVKPAPLPAYLMMAIESPDSDIRLGAVQSLTKLIKGKNLGLALSARQALEHMAAEDDSRRVAQVAAQSLADAPSIAQQAVEAPAAQEEAERIAQAKAEERRREQEKAETERKAQEEEQRLAVQRANEERIAREKAEVDRQAKEQAQRLALQRDKEEQLAREQAEADRKAQEQAQRLAVQKANEERIAQEKIEADRKAKEQAQRLALQREKEQQLAREKAEADRKAQEKAQAERAAAQKAEREEVALEQVKEAAVAPLLSQTIAKARVLISQRALYSIIGAVLIISFALIGRNIAQRNAALGATLSPSETEERTIVTATVARTLTATNSAALQPPPATMAIVETPSPRPSPSATPSAETYVFVTASKVYLYKGPDVGFGLAAQVSYSSGAKFTVLARNLSGQWLFCQAEDGNQGWLYQAWLDVAFDPLVIPTASFIPTIPPIQPTKPKGSGGGGGGGPTEPAPTCVFC